MNTSKIIKAYIGAGTYSTTEPITQGDYGYILQIEGAVLPAIYRVDFSNDRHEGEALPVYGNENGAEVPEELIATGKDIFAFYYYIGENFGKTAYTWKIPNDTRARYGDRTPTPTQQDSIDQLIVRSNEAVTSAEQSASAAGQSAQSALNSAIEANRAELSAKSHASNAERSSINADLSANDSSSSAEASAQSANRSAQIKAGVESLAEEVQGYADASEQSARASANSASQAQGFDQSASSSANSASGYASNAQTSANMASNKASEASQSATMASDKATEASQSASQALSYKNDAESAKTASQTAQGLAESARDSAISAKNDAESARDDAESARDEAQQAVASIADALDDKAPVITDTASGAIASFSDGADDLPLKSLVVDINPIQDLHGQENPYPAWGGVNKFKYNASVGTQIKNGVTWTLYEDGSIQVSGTASVASTFRYVLTERVEDDDFYFSGNYKFYAFPANISTADFQGGIKIGSKWYSVYADGYSRALNDADGKIVDAWLQVRDGKTVNATIRPMIYPESEPTPTAWSPYSNICPISGWTSINVNHSDEDMTNPTTLTIQLGQTVYGGKLDVLSGVLTVDRAMVDLGTLSWNKNESLNLFYTNISNAKYVASSKGTPCKCSALASARDMTWSGWSNFPDYAIAAGNNFATGAYNTTVKMSNYDSPDAFTAAMSGVQLCYELATPIEIQLSANQINSLLGVNNIWADSGGTTAEYRADTKLFIERLTAPDSADMIADANIVSGQYFMVGNSLYKATANIANGGQIVVGTNATQVSLAQALNEINA